MAEKSTPHEISSAGTKALFSALGAVNATRFLRQLEHGEGDYTKERQDWADKITFEQLASEAELEPSQEK